jgi:crotonobetainyl-CoA:carnitine CoA-transferase CaiB-like acyl-CoA transferase
VATGFFTELADARMGAMRFPGVPVKFDGVRPPVRMPPRLGEHTRESLAAAGWSAAQIDSLMETPQ